MPHEDPLEKVAEVAEEVAEAVEKNDSDPPSTSRPPPPGAPPSKAKQVKALIHLITSITALIAALGAFLKTCDHSMTENSYNTLSESIKTITENQQKTHDDLVALHGYLDGLTHAPLVPATALATSAPTVDAGGPASSASALTPFHPAPTNTIAAAPVPRDAGLITFAIQAPPLPSVQSTKAAAPPPPFAQAAAAK